MAKLRIRRYSASEGIFIILWIMYSFTYYILGASELSYEYDISGIYRYITYVIILIQMLALIYMFVAYLWKRGEFVQYLAVIILISLVEMQISDRSLLVCVLFIMLAQKVDIDNLLKIDIKIKIISFLIIVGMYAVGIVDNYTATSYTGSTKQSLGFGHPNTLTYFVISILVEWLVIRYKRMKWFEWVAILALAYGVMSVGGGRASFMTFIVIYVLFLLANIIPRIFYTKVSKTLFACATPAMAIISFVLTYLYSSGNSIVILLNSVLSNRFYFSDLALKKYGIKLFGQEVELVGTRVAHLSGLTSFVVDNAYVRCAILWGGLVFASLIVLYIFLFVKLFKMKRIDLALMSLFFVLLGIGESTMLNVLYNIALLYILGVPESMDATIETNQ